MVAWEWTIEAEDGCASRPSTELSHGDGGVHHALIRRYARLQERSCSRREDDAIQRHRWLDALASLRREVQSYERRRYEGRASRSAPPSRPFATCLRVSFAPSLAYTPHFGSAWSTYRLSIAKQGVRRQLEPLHLRARSYSMSTRLAVRADSLRRALGRLAQEPRKGGRVSRLALRRSLSSLLARSFGSGG